ncbi:hypothetical protein [Caulobacter sp. UC70_42]
MFVGGWAEEQVQELRDRRWLIPALMVSVAIWAMIIWGFVSAWKAVF